MSDENFDEESFAAYENELYGLNDGSDSDVESEVEDALYSQVHHSFSLPDDADLDDKGDTERDSTDCESAIVDISKPPVITISDDDDEEGEEEKNHDGFSITEQDIDSNHDAQNKLEEENHESTLENWDLIDKDMEDESKVKGGTSRYYAPNSKNSDKRCHNCNEKGHLAKDCPIPKKISCILCGMPGHTRVKCPNQLCFNCSQPGHRSFECSEYRARWTDECRRCYQKGHHSKTCPDIWRQYHRTTVEGIPPVRAEKCKDSSRPVYCYNCSARGHYGYECVEERPLDHAAFSTVQYIVRYDRHCHRPFIKTPKSDSPKRTHDRGKDYKDRTHERETEERTNKIHYQEQEFRKRLHDRQRGDSRRKTLDRDKDRTHGTGDHREDDTNRTLNNGSKEHERRIYKQEREDYRNEIRNQDNRKTPKDNSRKRIFDREIDEYSIEEHSKRRKSWPGEIRRPEGDAGYRDYIAGRLKDGRIDRGSEILEDGRELTDFRIDDVEIPPKDYCIADEESPVKGFKKKKKKRNKKRKLPDEAETSCLVTIKIREEEEKKKCWKNKSKRAVEYNSDPPMDDRPCLTRTVQLVDPEERRKSDSLTRIVDDWERINGSQDKGGKIPSIQRKIKHNKKGLLPWKHHKDRDQLPVLSNSQKSGPVFSRTDSSPGPISRKEGSSSAPKFEHRNVSFNSKSQEKKWPKTASNESRRGFRSKKKFYTL